MEWSDRAACKGQTHRFYATRDDAPMLQAKRIYSGCPVRLACLERAMDENELDGCWGGFNPKERRSLRRKWTANERNPEILRRAVSRETAGQYRFSGIERIQKPFGEVGLFGRPLDPKKEGDRVAEMVLELVRGVHAERRAG